ncbi:MAG: hypothetical protein II669_05475 [Elusimicrobia bacterium]|nr:hypothetical protein [Elusimicrobiota bacterium]
MNILYILLGIFIVNLLSFITLLITHEDENKVFTVAIGLLMPVVWISNFIFEKRRKKLLTKNK